jgi:Flp pilus assembly protein TadD
MTKAKLGSALTAVSLVALMTGCAGPQASGPKSASIFGSKVDQSNIGLATRAQVALASNDLSTARDLGERAVANSPKDAGFRALLGNIYLASGRFASAETAYRDSLTLVGTQPQVILKLALVQIAQGKAEEAKSLLSAAQQILDPSDLGLALALAGDPRSAIAILDPAARSIGADSRLRQNLALAYALAGDWTQARTVAAQDVPGDQLDARLQQWMVLAKPARASDQVAALIGVQPVASDPGQPVRLALNAGDTRRAEAQPAPAPVPVAAPAPVETIAMVDAPPVLAPVPVVEAAAPVVSAVARAPVVDQLAPVAVAASAPAVSFSDARPALSPAAVRLTDSVATLRRAAAPAPRTGRSRAVVQLGAYSSRASVAGAWSQIARKHGSLKAYAPVTARFNGAAGTVYRLSVKGFASDREAIALCSSLKRKGGSCFVRAVSGDAPVQFASR